MYHVNFHKNIKQHNWLKKNISLHIIIISGKSYDIEDWNNE